MPRKLPKERSDKWSHLTDRLTSSTPGYLSEIYYGEAYRITSEPSYGPNKGPSTADIDKALSPVEIIDRSSKTWWERAKQTSLCTLNAGIFLHVLFWVVLGIIFFMAIRVIKTPFGKPPTTKDVKVPGVNETSITQTPTNTSVPVLMVSSTEQTEREIPLGSIIPPQMDSEFTHSSQQTTFLTLVRTAPPEQPTINIAAPASELAG